MVVTRFIMWSFRDRSPPPLPFGTRLGGAHRRAFVPQGFNPEERLGLRVSKNVRIIHRRVLSNGNSLHKGKVSGARLEMWSGKRATWSCDPEHRKSEALNRAAHF